MARQLQGILYYLITDIRYSLTIFWSILGGFLLLTLILHFIIGVENASFAFNLSAPIYIFAGVASYITVKGVLPYLIKFGANRMNLFIGVAVFFIALAIFNSLVANILYSISTTILGSNYEAMFSVSDGETTVYLHHLADVLENSGWFTRILIDSSISFFLLTVFFISGLIFYRYGLIGGFSFVGVILVTFVFGLSNGWLQDFIIQIFENFSIVFFYQLTAVAFLIYLLSFFLLRRFTI